MTSVYQLNFFPNVRISCGSVPRCMDLMPEHWNMPFGRSFEIARGSSIPWIICGDFNATFDVGIKSLVLPIWRTLERLTLSCKTWSCRSLLLSADDFLGPMEKPSRCGLSWIVFLSIVCVWTLSLRWSRIVFRYYGQIMFLSGLRLPSTLLTCALLGMSWSSVDGFHELVEQWWSELSLLGCGAFILV